MKLYIGLVHYPVYNKNSEKIASSITNVDLHDLARLSRVYGVKRFFVVTPLEDQKKLAERIVSHWKEGYGATYNSLRKEAIELISVIPSIEETIEEIKKIEGEKPVIVTTGAARQKEKTLSYDMAVDLLKAEKAVLLLFGTAWGLHEEAIEGADFVLDPIEGNSEYNHLSVRAAAAIIIDRLAGR
jgi:hypothetical protein